jgi:N-acetyl-gamma-glutamyl-phosphate reductase/acetylglutamate kinase
LDNHPLLDLACVSSRELEGKVCEHYQSERVVYSNLTPADAKDRKDIDCWVLALPNGICKPFVDSLISDHTPKVILDLSADYRFDSNWHYGLPELYNGRQKLSSLKGSSHILISNPGCYATGAQLGIAPLQSKSLISGLPTVFGVSGYSGAGTKPSPNNDPKVLADNMIPYSLTDHMHEKEVSYHLGRRIAFIPHVASWFQGISLTLSIPLTQKITKESILDIYKDFYANESLIEVTQEIPHVKMISGHHGVLLGGFKVNSYGDRVVLVSCIDNLLKGAATQALANINLACGFNEMEGIK